MNALSHPSVVVRPRVTRPGLADPLPIDDVVADLLAEAVHRVIWITGGPGSGKTTALAYLQESFAGDPTLVWLDEPSQLPATDSLVVATTSRTPQADGAVLQLAPWGRDDLVEYLLAQHYDACGRVLARLGDWARRPWVPEVARVVLDELASDESISSPAEACFDFFERECTDRQLGLAVSRCLAQLSGDKLQVLADHVTLQNSPLTRQVRNLLRYQEVRIWLVAWYIAGQLEHQRSEDELHWHWPLELLDEVARKCGDKPTAVEHVARLLSGRRHGGKSAMAASLMLRFDPLWRPTLRPKTIWQLDRAELAGAKWPGIDLTKALLGGAVLSGAHLEGASLEQGRAEAAQFDHATLIGLRGKQLRAQGANFAHSDLTGAQLPMSQLSDANFTGANLRSDSLRGAICRGANFTGASLQEADLQGADLLACQWREADLSQAILSGAKLRKADFCDARLDFAQLDLASLEQARFDGLTAEEPCFRNARLVQADFTASTLVSPNFYNADLSGARLAEIDWQNANLQRADLRGATFHMGSSRSGLVNSPIALEGSGSTAESVGKQVVHAVGEALLSPSGIGTTKPG